MVEFAKIMELMPQAARNKWVADSRSDEEIQWKVQLMIEAKRLRIHRSGPDSNVNTPLGNVVTT